jgi:hypothetical protein
MISDTEQILKNQLSIMSVLGVMMLENGLTRVYPATYQRNITCFEETIPHLSPESRELFGRK